MPISATNLNKAYLAYYGRPADATGQAYFATLEQADVIKAFDASAESKAIYGDDTAAKINAIYKNLFNRDAEPAGLTYWLSLVASGRVTPAGAAFAILEGAQGTDKTAIDNKLAASEAFIKAMDTTAEIVGYSGLNAAASARGFLAAVGADAATLTAAVAGAQAAVTAATTAASNEAGSDTVLKTTQDILTGTAGSDTYRGVAGLGLGTQDQTTLNSSDIIDGAGGMDKLIVNMTGPAYNGGARIKNIETLQIGTNQAAAAFDYNVNQGANEITEVTTIVADQINVGEALTVQNILRTAGALPALSWVNDSNTALAGTVNYNYRAAELTGTTDTQVVSLDSVNNGVLNLAAGIETVTLRSVATERVTLLNSGAALTGPGIADTGTNAVAADILSSGSLTRVNIEAAAEVGKVGGRAANTGLIDRVATDGVGGANTGTQANLLSVGARVTTVDANTSTANVNVQFVAKTDGSATNVTFTGGAGNDYAEFEIGNITATGNAGNDVFAFVTQRNGVTNSTFGAGDTIVGGAGTDVIQIGDNGNTVGAKGAAGASTYTISDSEWANKSGVETVDLRGANNTITLSSGFVSAPDAGVKLTVTTDNMVVGGTAPANNEYNSVNTIDLRMLSGGQGINFVGGQGSDRLILSDSTFTSAMTLNGGSNVNAAATAVAGDYDTLTVSNSAVLDRTDLANVSGFEGLVLNKTVTGATTTVIEMSEAFLLANTVATNSVTTSTDDRVFQIGTAAGANGTALVAGDIVRIDVTDLFTVNNNTVKASVVGRQIDTTTLTNAGVTVQYVYNGTTYATLAALTTAVATVGGNAVLTGADAAGQTGVIGAAVGLPSPVTGVTYASGIGAASTLGTNNDDRFTLTQQDTVTGGNGADTVTFNAGSTAAQVTFGGTGADTANLNVALVGAGVLVMAAGGTVNIGADLGAYNMNGTPGMYVFNTTASTALADLSTTTTLNVTAAQTGLTIEDNVAALAGSGATGVIVNTVATGGGTFTLGAGGQTFSGAGTALNYVVAGGAGADTITLTNTGTAAVTAGAGIDTINITGNTGVSTIAFNGAGTGIVAVANRDVVTGFSAANDIIRLDSDQTTVAFAAVQSQNTAAAFTLGTGVASVTVLNFDLGGATNVIGASTDGSAITANLGGAITVTNADAGYIVAYDAGNAYLYSYTETTNTTLSAAEIFLIGTFNGVAVGALGTANFAEVA